MKITFYPESDLFDFSAAVREYEDIWVADGDRIVAAWEKYSGLQFKETFVNAVVFSGISCSHPLSLRHNYNREQKRIVLTHELGHRILYKALPDAEKLPRVANHYLLFLLLGDILVELFGNEALEQAIAFDRRVDSLRGARYGEAWEWVLSLTKEDRQNRFKRILGGEIELFGLEIKK